MLPYSCMERWLHLFLEDGGTDQAAIYSDGVANEEDDLAALRRLYFQHWINDYSWLIMWRNIVLCRSNIGTRLFGKKGAREIHINISQLIESIIGQSD